MYCPCGTHAPEIVPNTGPLSTCSTPRSFQRPHCTAEQSHPIPQPTPRARPQQTPPFPSGPHNPPPHKTLFGQSTGLLGTYFSCFLEPHPTSHIRHPTSQVPNPTSSRLARIFALVQAFEGRRQHGGPCTSAQCISISGHSPRPVVLVKGGWGSHRRRFLSPNRSLARAFRNDQTHGRRGWTQSDQTPSQTKAITGPVRWKDLVRAQSRTQGSVPS